MTKNTTSALFNRFILLIKIQLYSIYFLSQMHAQQQSVNICNTAIAGNHHNCSNCIKIYRNHIYKSGVTGKSESQIIKCHILLDLFPELLYSLKLSSFVFHFHQAKHYSTFQVLHSRVGPWPYPQILDQA
jgi:hypothetical protein